MFSCSDDSIVTPTNRSSKVLTEHSTNWYKNVTLDNLYSNVIKSEKLITYENSNKAFISKLNFSKNIGLVDTEAKTFT